MDELIGRQVRGYEITAQLGRGGYGAVYRAFQPSVGRDVAIKVILPQFAQDADFQQQFEGEAQLVAQLEHPYIVPLYDYWQDENGAFLVMRLVRGGSLRDILKEQGQLAPKQILRLYDHVCAALTVAHESQVIHRDIKPDNILLDQYTNAYLTDFGIAKNLKVDLANSDDDEEIIGTPAYLSPEQIRSLPVSAKTDIYALGIMLYELLTGNIPFDKPGMQVLMSHLQDPMPLLTDLDLPEGLDEIIARATAKEASDRYETVGEMAEALHGVFAPVVTSIIPIESQPRYVDPNRHVFIAHARQDAEFIQRLVYDLESEGIPVWVDQKGLKPGTRTWEDAIRSAIRDAYAVILVASPESRQSSHVLDELAIAAMYNCPVYPVWASGETWEQSVPIAMSDQLYIDARDDAYAAAFMEIVMMMGAGVMPDALMTTTEPHYEPDDDFVPRNPYKGLRAFRQEDQTDFFGRAGLVHELLDLIQQHTQPNSARLLAVVGPSGSGKSSVVMAGLLPALMAGALPESERWSYLPVIVPGADPLENLAVAIANQLPQRSIESIREDLREPSARGLHSLARLMVTRQSARMVLYIDQFEELFTQTTQELDRQQFINLLLTAVTEPGGSVTVILSLRADFYDRPMNYPELGKLIESNSKSVLPMSLSDLHDVIQKPAQLPDVLLKFDVGLVAELVFEVRDQLGGLPLLQFTLDQLFEKRNGRRLTNSAYLEIGGVRGALAKHTEATFAGLPSDEHRRLARGLFLRLIEPGATEQDTTRRRAPRNELVLADAQQNRMMDAVINAFVDARLLLTDQTQGVTTVEVSHEALIREWARLGEWLEEARGDISRQQNISADTVAWIERGRRDDDDGLYRGTLLEDAQAWAARNLPSSDEMSFLARSAATQAERQRKEAEIAKRVQNFSRATRVLGVMSVLAIVAFIAAVLQVSSAQSQLTDANQQVAAAGDTLTPIPLTLTPIAQQLATSESEISTAQVNATEANLLAGQAQTAVVESGMTLTPVAGTLAAGDAQLAAAQAQISVAETQVYSAQDLAEGAQTAVAESNATQTPIALTLVAGNQLLITAEIAVTEANLQALEARTLVAESAQTLTPVAVTLAAGANLLATGDAQLATAQIEVTSAREQAIAAQTEVAEAEILALDAQDLAQGAQTEVAQSNATQTPIALTLVAGNALLGTAEFAVIEANEQAQSAQTQVAIAEETVLESALTLTPVALTLAAGDAQLATAQVDILAARDLADDAQTAVAQAGKTLTPVPQTLTPIAATLAAANTQVAGVQPTLDNASTQVAGVQPTVAAANLAVQSAQTEVADAGQALTPIAATLVAAESTAIFNANKALSQSLAVSAEEAVSYDDYDLALALALESIQLDANLVQSQRLLNQLVYTSARLSFENAPIAAISPVNDKVVTADGSIATLWDITTRQPIAYLNAHLDEILGVDFSPDGNTLVTASADSTLIVWDAHTGALLQRLENGHVGRVNAVQFHPEDSTTVLSGGADGVNIGWNTLDGSQRYTRTLAAGRGITRVHFGAGGQSFWSWEVINQQVIMVYWSATWTNAVWTSDNINYTQIDPRNRRYAARQAHEPVIMDAPGLTVARTLSHASLNNYEQTAIGFSTTASQVLTTYTEPGTTNVHLYLWDYATGTLLQSALVSNADVISTVVYSPQGDFAALGMGKFIVLWDTQNFREVRRLSAHKDIVNQIQFSDDGRYLLSISADGNSRVWEVSGADPAEQQRIVAKTEHNQVTFLAMSPDGQDAYAGLRFSMFGWDTHTGDQKTRVDTGDRIVSVVYHPSQPYAMTVLPRVARIWDMSKSPNPTIVRDIGSLDDLFSGIVYDGRRPIAVMGASAFSADGQFVVTDSRTLSLRNAQTNGRMIDFNRSGIPERHGLVSVVLTHDNRYLLGVYARYYEADDEIDVSEPAGDVIVWDVETGEEVRRFGALQHTRRINHLALSHDGQHVLTSSNDGTMIMWEIATGRLVRRLSGHRGAVNKALFTPDDRFVISASDDNTLILWELSVGQVLRRFSGHSAPVKWFDLSADGQRFVSSTGDNTIIVWQLEGVGEVVSWTKANRYIRQFTCDDGEQFGLTAACEAS